MKEDNKIKLQITQQDLENIQKNEAKLEQLQTENQEFYDKISLIEQEILKIEREIIEKKSQIPDISHIQKEIDQIMPILEQTEQSISLITPKELNELSYYNRPPPKLQLGMEAIFFLLTSQSCKWDYMKKELNNGNFISSVLELDSSKVTLKTIKNLESKYLKSKDWEVEKIKKSSQALRPFIDWLNYEIIYIKLQKKILPRQKEIREKHAQIKLLLQKENELKEQVKQMKSQQYKNQELAYQLKKLIHSLYELALEKQKQRNQQKPDKGVQCGDDNSREESVIIKNFQISDTQVIYQKYVKKNIKNKIEKQRRASQPFRKKSTLSILVQTTDKKGFANIQINYQKEALPKTSTQFS